MMTWKQIIGLALLSFAITGVVTRLAWGQTSRPADPRFHALQHELAEYVEEYAHALRMPRSRLQWAVMVLPALEFTGPAIGYHWPVIRSGSWLSIFTFQDEMMLGLPPDQRRVIVAHEIGHITSACWSFGAPHDADDDLVFHLKVLEESCADLISAQLNSPLAVLEMLEWLNRLRPGGTVMAERLTAMRELVAEERKEEEDARTH